MTSQSLHQEPDSSILPSSADSRNSEQHFVESQQRVSQPSNKQREQAEWEKLQSSIKADRKQTQEELEQEMKEFWEWSKVSGSMDHLDFERDRAAKRIPPQKHIMETSVEEDIEEQLYHYVLNSREPEISISAYAKSMGVEPQQYLDLADKIAKRRGVNSIKHRRYREVMNELKRIQSIENPSLRYWEMCELGRSKKVGLKQLEVLLNLSDEEDKPAEYATLAEWFQEYSKGGMSGGSLIDGFLPESTTILLYADGGIGKTTFAYDLAASVARGENWNGLKTKQAPVLILQGDEPAQITLRTFDIKGVGDGHPDIHLTFNWSFNQIPSLGRKLEETGAKLIIVDSLTSANRHSGFEEKDIAYGACLYQLRDMAVEFGATFLVLHHENKGGAVRGTTALKNNVSEVWRLTRPASTLQGFKETHRLLFMEKSRSGNTGKIIQLDQDIEFYSWENQGEFDPESLARDNTDGVQKEPSLRDKILALLRLDKGTRYSVSELVEKFKVSDSGIKKELNRLYIDGLIKFEFATKTAGRGLTKYKLFYVEDDEAVLTRNEVTELIQASVLPSAHTNADTTNDPQQGVSAPNLPLGADPERRHQFSDLDCEKNIINPNDKECRCSEPLQGETLGVDTSADTVCQVYSESKECRCSEPLQGETLGVDTSATTTNDPQQGVLALNPELPSAEKHYDSTKEIELEMTQKELDELHAKLASLDEILETTEISYGDVAEEFQEQPREFKVGDSVALSDEAYLYDEVWIYHGTIEVIFGDCARVKWAERVERGLPSGLQIETYELTQLRHIEGGTSVD